MSWKTLLNFNDLADRLKIKGWLTSDDTAAALELTQKSQPRRWVKNYCETFDVKFRESMVDDLRRVLKEIVHG